ncbi:hypothetical protein LG277_03345 [Vreelandella aquamarina]|uniref:hypothetical protein n=1 Tax=Vreelandella aquamarina TaxID=77097 RepID=UPI00384D65A7
MQGEPGGVSNDFDIEEKLEEKLLDYEVAIANLAGRIRALKASPEQLDKQNNGKEKISMVLDKQPEMLGRIKAEKKYIVTGTSDLVLENKQILIFFKATPESNFPGFNYSKSLEGFFKYLSVDNGFFKTEFVIHDKTREFVDVFISLWNFKNTNLPVELEVFVE